MSVPVPQLPPRLINFSFQYYDLSREDYCLSYWTQEQIRETFTRLREISALTYAEFFQQRSVYHFHSVDWSKTTEKAGFARELGDLEAFQFALLSVNGQLARVFGAFYDGTFYVVWFDLDHRIWPSEKRHT